MGKTAKKTASERKNISAPPDHWAAWQAMADAAGLSLSDWMGRQCNAALPTSARRGLAARRAAGRPKTSAGQ